MFDVEVKRQQQSPANSTLAAATTTQTQNKITKYFGRRFKKAAFSW